MRYFPGKIEAKWQKKWLKEKTYEPDLERAKKPFYNLMMFPYPSAEGLHIGAVRTFSGVDIYGRLKRMQGFDVFEPIGLDGFGIHSENYALKVGKHPVGHAKDSEKNFYRQLDMIGNGFAWNERLQTYDPEYYRWTQWIFVQMFKRGLAYRKKASVNWCPSCKTVLADEQVIAGECERCGTKVIKKELEQWFFRITEYAERLLGNLEKIDWSEKIKIAQKNWIGKSEGLIFSSPVKDTRVVIETFSAHFEAFTADTFLVIAPDHPILPALLDGIPNKTEILAFCRKILSTRKKTGYDEREPEGVFTGRYTIDPIGNGNLPIWVASYALAEYGTGIVKCSAHDERDFAFAKKYRIRLKPTLVPEDPHSRAEVLGLKVCYSDTQHGILTEPAPFAGKRAGTVRADILRYCVEKNLARPHTTYKLRDWLISRQRYWGPPIPLVFCESCKKLVGNSNPKTQNSKLLKGFSEGELQNPGWIAVSEKDLPVRLPYIKNFRPTGTDKSPLAAYEKFYKTRCPKCARPARRETDVSDAFLDSAWYFLRYPSVRDKNHPWTPVVTRKWLPVDMYIGGAEHSVLHLLYSRFLTMVFKDWGLLGFEEPFSVFRAHGLITKDGAKMSKSKGNVVNPDEYIKAYGIDAIRMYLAFLAPFEQGGDFRAAGIRGITRFLERVWKFGENPESRIKNHESGSAGDLNRLVNNTVKKVTDDIEHLRYNTAVSALMVLLNAFEENGPAVGRSYFLTFLKLLAPFAPHITEELWQEFGEKGSIHKSQWPEADLRQMAEENRTVVIQINGRVRDKIETGAAVGESEMRKLALSRPAVQKWLGTKKPKKFIYVAGRVANIVI